LKKKVLITGFSGMVGSHLADYLLKNTNYKIYGACRWRSPNDNFIHLSKVINLKKRLFLEYMDLNDTNSINLVIKKVKPDFVYHLAAQSFPLASFQMSNITYETNVNGTHKLLDAIKNNKINPLIHVCSSSEVFGRVSKKYLPIDESVPYHPASPYAISKVGTELIGKFFFEAYGLNVLITRMFTHTGPRRSDFFAESSFAKQIALIENKFQKPVLLVGNVNSLRTIADVRDAVKAYYLLLHKQPQPGEIYNIGGDKSLTIQEIIDYMISISSFRGNIEIKVDKSRLRPIDADLQVPNTKKFRSHTGWKPMIKYKKTLSDLLEYWRIRIARDGEHVNR